MSWDWEAGKTFETSSEYPALGCSGPLWVQGGIAIESEDGHRYETRNR
jgi:hypothetical protein